MFTVDCECPFCRRKNTVNVVFDDYVDWMNGTLIQDAMPYLSADDRELLKTGICKECWDKMF